ncbi:MAG TPA: ATP-binding protein [Ohtaekwangia sp.]|nr:ATP-binding protein [Ohtaekwangia sp.]
MIYKNFRVSIFIRVLIILFLAMGFAFVLMTKPALFIPVAIAVVLVVAVINLIQYIEKSNRDMAHFLLSLRQGAFTESYTSGNRGKVQEELSGAMNDIVKEFAHINEQRELHYQYLQALNENIGIAILSFDLEGNLIMMNPAAKHFLRYPGLTSVRDLSAIDKLLHDKVSSVKPEEREVIKTIIHEAVYQLGIQVKEIILQGKPVRIVLVQNLNNELEEKEIEAWHTLMRVLTHEIMNSVTPIASLTSAMQSILHDHDGRRKEITNLSEENIDDIFSSISTITSRSKGLLRFVSNYNEYGKTMQISVMDTDVVDLINTVVDLFVPDLEKYAIDLSVEFTDSKIPVRADAALIEQVIINLLKNAMEAVPHDGTGRIKIAVQRKHTGRIAITVQDNGAGIDPEIIDTIFVPFFTTKENGTGIGLSLSRQIMKLHNGNIQVHSSPGTGSRFTMEWS